MLTNLSSRIDLCQVLLREILVGGRVDKLQADARGSLRIQLPAEDEAEPHHDGVERKRKDM